MESEKIDTLKSIIVNRLKELSKRSFDKNVDLDGDESDEVQGVFILNMACEYNDRNNYEIRLLYEAMQKIDKGEYGLCEECGGDIGFKRLAICPGTKFCIRCAEVIEKENKSFRAGRL